MRRGAPLLLALATLLVASACSQKPQVSSVPQHSKPTPAGIMKPAGCEAAEPVAQWLSQQAIPLKSLTAGAGFADLEKLKPALEGVRVVGLGEATHGSREFFTMKHRMLEFLVTEMGYTLFGIEAGYPEALNLNQYVLTGQGNPHFLVWGMGYWPWATQEVLDLVEWMREYNQKVPPAKQVRFLGFDTQTKGSAWPLSEYLKKVAPGTASEALSVLERLHNRQPETPSAGGAVNLQTKADAAALQGIIDTLAVNREAYVKASSADEYQVAVNLARNLARFHSLLYAAGDGVNPYIRRDQYMTETALELLEQAGPGAKMVLWAHNMHIADAKHFMGGQLRKALGKDYYAIGFAFDHGELNAIDTRETTGRLAQLQVGAPKTGQLDWYFACAGLGNAVVDYRRGDRSEAVATWLSTTTGTRAIGAAYNPDKPEETETTIHPDAWDAMIYIPTVTATNRI